MADGVAFDLEGLDELRDKLQKLAADAQYRGGRSALRKAAELVAVKARENALRINDPQSETEIAKNIAFRWDGRHFKQSGDMKFRIGVLGGARRYAESRRNTRSGRAGESYGVGGDKTNPGGDTFYWRYLEFGTSKMAAKPFLRSALADNIGAATDMFINEFDKTIDRALKRAARKARRR